MNWCNILTATQNSLQWRFLIYMAMKNMKCQNKYGVERHSTSLVSKSD